MAGEIEAYIREAAARYGINPDIAVRVAMSEGGVTDPVRQAEAMLGYGREESYGPFQLHIRNGGLGARALAAGIDPRDPNQWRQGVDFALQEASKRGWGQWFGAAKAGIDKYEGIGGEPSQAKQFNLPPPDPLGAFGDYAAKASQPPATGGLPGPVGHPPNPTVGTGDLPAIDAPYAAPEEKKPESLLSKLGKGVTAGAKAYASAKPFSYDVPSVPGPARVDVAATPFIDPQQAEMRRAQLAQVLARLNSGSLF